MDKKYKLYKKIVAYLLLLIFIIFRLISYCKQLNVFEFYYYDYLILLIIFLIMLNIHNIYNYIIIYTWMLWIIIGNICIYNSYNYFDYHVVDTKISNNIYLIYLLIFSIGIFSMERIIFRKSKDKDFKILVGCNKKFTEIILIIFPLISIIESYIKWGYIPILSHENVMDVMYELEYGFFNKYFGILNIFSAIYMFFKIFETKSKKYKLIYAFLFVIPCFASMMNGARFKLLVIIISITFISFRYFKKIRLRYLILVAVILCAYYVILPILREGNLVTNTKNIFNIFNSIGCEYREWTRSLQILNGTKLVNYNFLKDFLSPLVSNKILDLLNINKYAGDFVGSAEYFRMFFNSRLGIRIGIIGELYYAYNFYSIIIFYFFAIAISIINNVIINTNSFLKLIVVTVVSASFLLTIMGQINTFTSMLKSIIYIYIIYIIINKLVSKSIIDRRSI